MPAKQVRVPRAICVHILALTISYLISVCYTTQKFLTAVKEAGFRRASAMGHWLDILLAGELGPPAPDPSARKAAAATLIQLIAARRRPLLVPGVGESPMGISVLPAYRLYFLDPHNGHIDGVENFHSSDDVEAVCLVAQREALVPMELWRGDRKISRFDAPMEAAAAVRVRGARTAAAKEPA